MGFFNWGGPSCQQSNFFSPEKSPALSGVPEAWDTEGLTSKIWVQQTGRDKTLDDQL